MTSPRVRLIAGAVLCAAALATAACGGGSSSVDGLPDIELASADGSDPLNLAGLEGPALVNVWATWCVPCKKELPDLQAIADDPSVGVDVIGINVGDEPQAIDDFLTQLRVGFPNYTDPDGIVQTEFAISGLPATIAVRADGTVATVHQGPLDEQGFRDLAAQAAAPTTSTNS
jgi:thiol-disulfide isomerase/thioredoxin